MAQFKREQIRKVMLNTHPKDSRMTGKVFLLLVLICAVVFRHTPAMAFISSEVLKYKKSVVTVYVKQDDKVMTTGSGFIVSKDGIIVTNHHVITTGSGFIVSKDGIIVTNHHVITELRQSPVNKLSIKTSDGSFLTPQSFDTVDKTKDLVLIRVLEKELPAVVLAEGDKETQGDDVVVIGSPLGLETTVSDGIISSIRGNDGYIQITAPISRGSSGSPVFNRSGEVIGIATFIFEGGQNLNFAVPARYIKRLMADASPAPADDSEKKQPAANLSADEWFQNAKYLFSREAYGDAFVSISKAIAADGSNPQYYSFRAMLLWESKNFDAALKDSEKALALAPEDDELHAKKAFILFEMERLDEAVACLDAAIKKNPQKAFYFNYRGLLYFISKKYEKALADFTKATVLAPTEAKYIVQRGMAQQLLKNYKKALADYDYALQLYEEDDNEKTQCLKLRADLKYEMVNLQSAEEDYRSLCKRGHSESCQLASEVQRRINRGENWVLYAENSNGKTAYFNNKTGIRNTGSYMTVWERQESNEDGSYVVSQAVINCKTSEIGMSKYVSYGSDGSVLSSNSYKPVKFTQVIPDTVGQEFVTVMCKKKR